MALDKPEEILQQFGPRSLTRSIAIHASVIAHPFHLDRQAALDDRAWIARAGQIAEHDAGLFPPSGATP